MPEETITPKGKPGRPKGLRNKATLGAFEFVEKVERRLLKQERIGLIDVAVKLLVCNHPPTVGMVWKRLNEWRYGMPIQPIAGELRVVHELGELERAAALSIARKISELQEEDEKLLEAASGDYEDQQQRGDTIDVGSVSDTVNGNGKNGSHPPVSG